MIGKDKPLKPKRCKVCPDRFTPRNSMQVVCSPKCGLEYAAKQREGTRKQQAKKDRSEIAKRKESLKTRSDYLKEAQIAFNACRREVGRIAGHACISCDRPLDWNGNQVDAGHYRSVGSAPHLRFTENNVWCQCKQCNRYGAGRAVDYRIGLIKRIGLAAVEALEADQEPRKWSIDELKEIKRLYVQKRKQLTGSSK